MDRTDELAHCRGLYDVAVHSGLEHLLNEVFVRMDGQCEELDPGQLLPERPGDLDTRNVGKADIQDEKVGNEPAGDLDRFFPGSCLAYDLDVGLAREQSRQ